MRNNYKKKYGITLKWAKEQYKRQYHRLPRVGYTGMVCKIEIKGRLHEIYLDNDAGKYSLWDWTSVNG